MMFLKLSKVAILNVIDGYYLLNEFLNLYFSRSTFLQNFVEVKSWCHKFLNLGPLFIDKDQWVYQLLSDQKTHINRFKYVLSLKFNMYIAGKNARLSLPILQLK